ncbi:hypothetical protein ABTZ58_06930 [Streptomyces sp. NPDC094143]|uniref:hypothetical protein n=1 Tax=Streptomyces sp. NPDC094143 TaxID=3155310 RepID=UPI00333395C4
MPQLPAAAEPRHSSGGAGGAARGQWVKYPLRVVTDAEAYAPADTNFYGKVKALSKGRRATASMTKLAAYLGCSKSTVERAARRLGRPAPTDGVQELFTRRQTHRVSGTGQTAERWCRDLERGEAYVWGPVRAADSLTGIEHRLYLGLRYSIVVKGHQPTLSELAQLLRHHGGEHAGRPLAEASVARLLDRLSGYGWISVDKRAGYRGRHLITVHDDPVQPATDPAATPDPGDGSGPDLADGSLAYKEDQQLNDPRNTDRRGPSAVGEVTVSVRPPVDTPGNPTPATFRSAPRTACPPSAEPLTLPPRVWAVLEPVRDLLPAVRPFVLRRIRDEVARQLDTGVLPEDITDQLRLLRAWTPHEDLTDPGRWILGAALPAQPGPCGLTDCVRGFMRHTGAPCKACADHRTQRPAPPAPAPVPPPPRHASPPRATPHPGVPPPRPPAAPPSRVGPPPLPGGWRALVARERPADAARTYRHRWRGDDARLLPPETA